MKSRFHDLARCACPERKRVSKIGILTRVCTTRNHALLILNKQRNEINFDCNLFFEKAIK